MDPNPHLLCSTGPAGGELPLLPRRGWSPGEGAHTLLDFSLLLPFLQILVHGHLPALLHRQEVGGQREGGVARQTSVQDELWLLLFPFLLLTEVFWQNGAIAETL